MSLERMKTYFSDKVTDKNQAYNCFEDIVRSGGRLPGGGQVSVPDLAQFTLENDFVGTANSPMWIPKVINTFIQEAIEPLLVGEHLLQKIKWVSGTQVQLGTMGAISGDFEMGEANPYPEVTIQIGEGTSIRHMGKSGVMVKFSEEILRESNFPIVETYIKHMARALARAKESKIFNMIGNLGQTVFDNESPDEALIGTTSGRSFLGVQNGSITVDDLFDLMSQVMTNGFMPNTFIIHPFTWVMFAKDPNLRMFALNSGGGSFFGGWTGNPVDPANGDWANFGGLGQSKGIASVPANAASGATATAINQYSQNIEAAPKFPNYFGYPFNVIVSPFVDYDVTTRRTEIICCDSNELGYLVEDHPLQVSDWDDPMHDIYNVKLKERYVLAIANEGNAIARAKGVQVSPGNEIVLPAMATHSVDGTIQDLDRTTSPFSSSS